MKKILLSLFIMAVIGFTAKVRAQCTLSNIVVNLNSATPSGGNCIVNMNITFDMTFNSGNKYIWLNIWKSNDYGFVTFNYGAGGAKGPTLDELNGASNTHAPVAVIGINNNVTPVVYLTNYSPDPTNITPTTGATITKTSIPGFEQFVLSNVTFTVPGACAGLILQGDVWSSQANSANSPIHCYSQGISFFGDPTINGQVICTNPRQAQVLLNTVSTAPLTVNYTVYLDKGVIGTKEPGDPVAISTSSNFSLSSSTPYNSGPMNYIGNNVPIDADRPLLVEVNVLSPFGKTIYGNIFNNCSPPLPVNIVSFSASRSNSNVTLRWQTNWEQNSSGFAIERNTKGSWEEVGFVNSQAQGGNSSDLLSYQYLDINNSKGITQYRLRQVDFDNKSKYSEIRTVRGESQIGKIIVYPNPTFDGKVNVSFEDATVIRDISLIDMNGRILNQWKAFATNQLSIGNLTPGLYTLRVVLPETGEQLVEKIVVNKR